MKLYQVIKLVYKNLQFIVFDISNPFASRILTSAVAKLIEALCLKPERPRVRFLITSFGFFGLPNLFIRIMTPGLIKTLTKEFQEYLCGDEGRPARKAYSSPAIRQ
jgi:hypothetical protein